LNLCGGNGCYRETGFEAVWDKVPVDPVVAKSET